MFSETKKEIKWGNSTLTLETGKLARQADGSVKVSYGETVVFAAAVGAKKAKDGIDFFPLTINYQEKTYAAGRIPGGYFKREGRPTEKETLVSRLIDRPIRPLFPKGFKNEVQITTTTLCYDNLNNPDIPAIIASSAALAISGLPFMGPVGASRVGYIDGKLVLNPTDAEMENSSLDLIVAGTREGVLMVESEAHELSEELMLEAVTFGWDGFQPVITAIEELAKKAGKPTWELAEENPKYKEVSKKVDELGRKGFADAYGIKLKQERSNKLNEIRDSITAHFAEDETVPSTLLSGLIKELEGDVVRSDILETGNRIDGRDTKTVRPIVCEVGLLPRTHGSALFTRGETQALVVTTLGTGDDEQIIDALEGEYKETFLLHYNFPPFSVGECGRVGSPGRREIGHGKLAWRAIHPLLPSKEEFPYTLRVVSEIFESNGSSSMATVCGTSMSLMNAGVPLAKPVAGIAMGLIKEGEKFAVLTDILGDEDHLGDMDFKVAGTKDGITALQMDIKITSITSEIMKIALGQAKDGRLHILQQMAKAITESSSEISEHAPQMECFQIPKDKIRDVIGSGGKIIREIIEVTGAKIDIEDDGTVRVSAVNRDGLEQAVEWIQGLVEVPQIGKIYEGQISKIMDFGAFVTFLPNTDGLVHVSELKNERVQNVTDVVNEGEIVKVKLLEVDPRGKYRLSMRVVDQETGEELPDTRPAREERSESGDRPEKGDKPRRDKKESA